MSSSPAAMLYRNNYHHPRDPGGVTSAGVELKSGEDPVGVAPVETSTLHAASGTNPPPTPSRRGTPSKMPISAMMVGIPPPPPPGNPPPKKKRGSTPRKGRASEQIVNSATLDSSPSTRNAQSGLAEERMKVAKAIYNSDSLSSSSPSTRASQSSSVVEERLKAARAIYNSDSLVLDPPTGGGHVGQHSTSATPTAGSSHSASSSNPKTSSLGDQENELPTRVIKHLPSPMSVATEPHANHSASPLSPHSATPPPPPLSVSNVAAADKEGATNLDTSKSDSAVNAARRFRPKTPERLRKVFTPDGRRGRSNKTPDSKTPRRGRGNRKTPTRRRRSKTPEARQSPVETNEKRRGFFRKMFGANRKGSLLDDSSDSQTMDTEQVPSQKSRDKVDKHSKKEEHHGTNASSFGVEDERPSVFFASDDVSTLTAPTVESKHPRRRQDPDPQIEKDNSFEPLGQYWSSFSATPDSVEQNERSFDPFAEPFFSEPEGTTAMTTTRTERDGTQKRPGLSVSVPDVHHDPLGESPVHSVKMKPPNNGNLMHDPSPRGFLNPPNKNSAVQDPFGESPLHKHQRGPDPLWAGSPYAPDPPLYLMNDLDDSGLVSEGSLSMEEEKKLEERENKANAPPPPPLASRTRSREVMRIPVSPSYIQKTSVDSPASSHASEKETILSAAMSPRIRMYPKVANSPTASSVGTTSSLCDSDTGRGVKRETVASSVPETVKEMTPPVKQTELNTISVKTDPISDPVEETKPTPVDEKAEKSEESPTEWTTFPKEPGPRSKTTAQETGDAVNDEQHVPKQKVETPTPTTTTTPHAVGASKPERAKEADSTDREVEYSPTKKSEESPRPRMLSKLDIEPSSGGEQRHSSTKNAKNSLTMSHAARMNAQAVAYLHTLNGEPSPRHTWHQSGSDDDASPPTTGSVSVSKMQDGFFKETTKEASALSESSDGVDKDAVMKLFSAYSGKFKGRKPAKAGPGASATKGSLSQSPANAVVTDDSTQQAPKVPAWKAEKPVGRDVSVKGDTVTFGCMLFRANREDDIACGRATRVVPVKKAKIPRVKSYFGPLQHEPKDPIQRAGRRLLSKAAIPIQSAARRYLAQCQAVDRLWATIEIQCHMRRWRAEAFLFASRYSARMIQKVFRGTRCRGRLDEKHEAATQIQKVIRSYLTAAMTYDAVYRIILIQAQARGNSVRDNIKYQARAALIIQTPYRGHRARKTVSTSLYAIRKVQALWRSYAARLQYQFDVVDIIITQNIARRWLAKRKVAAVRASVQEAAATKIQARYRCFQARSAYTQDVAATKIQAQWRGFQGYTDFIFALVDVLVVQRTARQWLARRKVDNLRRTMAATKIQTHFRRFREQMNALFKLAHIMIVQSIVRRYLVRSIVEKRRAELDVEYIAATKIQTAWRGFRGFSCYVESVAATKIQAAWRGFWQFSHYVILHYETVRLQAMARRNIARSEYDLKLGCAIMIQSAVRRYLAKWQLGRSRESQALVSAAAEGMRETLACKRIQFWWCIVLDCRKEKEAALVIERFFISVKEEVEREIRRVEQRRISKKEQRRKKKKEADDNLLERVWLNTVDENQVEVFALTSSKSYDSRSQSTPRRRFPDSTKHSDEKQSVRHRASSPPMDLIMRHEYEAQKAPRSQPFLNFAGSEDASEVSGMTSEAPGNSSPLLHRRSVDTPTRKPMTRAELREDRSLEEAFLQAEGSQSKEKGKSVDDFLMKYGMKTAPSRSSRMNHFFADDLESALSSSTGLEMKKSRKSTSSIPSSRSGLGSPSATSRSKDLASPHRTKSQRPSSNQKESPRHAKILVMNPYPEYPAAKKSPRETVEVQFLGEEFGLI